ncbi:MAG: regulator of nucleoside diphosphate kinase [Pseudohongiellaceae bacterium]|jgi:regulator of nucleoside diphosphate kinase
MKKNHRKIIIKNSDFAKLQNLIEKSDSKAAEVLEAEILNAKLVEDSKLPIDVVAMGSTVTFKRKEGDEITVVTLVYPQQADMEKKKISILTPVGSALIGLQTGSEIDWPMPNGKLSHFEVVAVQQA